MTIKYKAMSNTKYAICGGVVGVVLFIMSAVLTGPKLENNTPMLLYFAPIVLLYTQAQSMASFIGTTLYCILIFDGSVLLHVGYAALLGWGNRRNKGERILFILLLFHFGMVGLSVWVLPEYWDFEKLKKSYGASPTSTIIGFVPFVLTLIVTIYAALKTRDIEDDVPAVSIKYHAMSNRKYMICGGVIGAVLMYMAFAVAGAGHGTGIPLILFFAPISLLSSQLIDLTSNILLTVISIGSSVPLYMGYATLLGWGNRRNKGRRILLILLLFHFGSVGAVFLISPYAWDMEYLQKSYDALPWFTIMSFTTFALVVILTIYVALKKQSMVDDAPQCHNCKYNLTGNTSGVCPECGEKIVITIENTPPAAPPIS